MKCFLNKPQILPASTPIRHFKKGEEDSYGILVLKKQKSAKSVEDSHFLQK